MMPTFHARPERLAPGGIAVDLLLAIGLALVLAATARGAAPVAGLASSENFTVWADSQAAAEALLERAEVWRARIAREWIGEPLPPGAGRTSLNVQISDRDTAHAWLANPPQDDGHLIWLRTTAAKLDTALGHELTHIVLATHAPNLPAFVQEGIAGQYDDDERRALRQATLQGFVRSGRWPRLRDVLEARSIAPSDRAGYTAAVSLTEFLLAYGGGQNRSWISAAINTNPSASPAAPRSVRVLLAFAADGARSGRWDEAVQHYYAADVAGLEAAWQAWERRSLARRPGR